MSRRAVGATVCAAAAIALVAALAVPWWRVVDHEDEDGARTHFSLFGGERCASHGAAACKTIEFAGRPGVRDDLFAWAGRMTGALAVATAALAVAMAFSGGRRHPLLRATVAGVAMTAAAGAAAAVSIERLPPSNGTPELGAGLWLMLVGCALSAACAAWPLAGPDPRAPARRYGLGAAIVIALVVAWATVALRMWWSGDVEFGTRTRSPLGYELCDLGTCARFGNGLAAARSYLILAAVSAAAAAALVAAAGAAVRVVRGIAPAGFATAMLVATTTALVAGGVAVAIVPRRDTTIAVGAWLFLAAMAGAAAAALLARRWITAVDVEVAADAATSAGQRVRPVLAPLGAGAAPAPPAIAAYTPALARPPTASGPKAPLPPRASPLCPTCRGSTLWHGKRGAWFCSQCKQTL